MKVYEIHGNNGRPYCVEINELHAEVFLQTYVKEDDYYMLGRKIFYVDAEKVWIGDNDRRVDHTNYYHPKGLFPGNSILLQIKENTYLYIGSEIYAFHTTNGDVIMNYYSPVEHDDDPRPYAVGQHAVYFMLEKCCVPISSLDMNDDLYKQIRLDSIQRIAMNVEVVHKQ